MDNGWIFNTTLYEMNVRQLTPQGTLRAAMQRLPFLRDMGVGAIWLMPIYPIGRDSRKGSMGSFYSIRDYCAVGEEFGALGDFDAFVDEAHRLGLRVVMDWVANHTSRDARWIEAGDAALYERDESGEPLVPWDWSDTAQLNYQNHDVWRAQITAMRFWVERGIDGFRCDMAMLVPLSFWQMARVELKAINSDLFFLAEAEGVGFFDGAFDCVYGWEFHHLIYDIAQGYKRTDALRDYLYWEREHYGRRFMKMRFTSNHDENSWKGSHLERFGAAHEVMSVLCFVAPASLPLIYTGQEVECDHSFSFFERDPIAVEYRATATSQLYGGLSALRKEFEALSSAAGKNHWVTISNNAEDCLLILVRESARDRVVAVMNLSPYTIHSQYDTGIYEGHYRDAFTGEEYHLSRYVDEHLAPWSYRLLTQRK